mmetsp:Transcript_17015/g.40310  ORF Transcript_17015/g.40310 Transcript_17015/m.40310 type:complete len:102 (+) Transcript_17015:60-365(+)
MVRWGPVEYHHVEAFEGAWHPDPEDVVINIVPEVVPQPAATIAEVDVADAKPPTRPSQACGITMYSVWDILLVHMCAGSKGQPGKRCRHVEEDLAEIGCVF